MEKKTSPWVWVGVVAVVIIAAIAVAVGFMGKNMNGPAPVYAPPGQTVSGFPAGLVLDAQANGITNSYSVNYSSSTNQYTAEWMSTSSVEGVFTDYLQYAALNNWTITGTVDTDAMKGFNATNASTTLNLVIVPQGDGSKVTVTYIAQ